jgi:hypothetical protein
MSVRDDKEYARRMAAAKKMPRNKGVKEVREITGMALEDAAILWDVETGHNPDGDVDISK